MNKTKHRLSSQKGKKYTRQSKWNCARSESAQPIQTRTKKGARPRKHRTIFRKGNRAFEQQQQQKPAQKCAKVVKISRCSCTISLASLPYSFRSAASRALRLALVHGDFFCRLCSAPSFQRARCTWFWWGVVTNVICVFPSYQIVCCFFFFHFSPCGL